MSGRWFEDFKVGDKFVTPGKTVTEGAIATMIGLGGFIMPLFNDEEFAKTTPFGTRIAPGRLTLFLMGGLEEQTGVYEGCLIALLSIDKVQFKGPLKTGDTIRVEMEVTDTRPTSKPDRGVVVHKSICRNQRGEVVVETEAAHLLRRRPK